MLDVGRTTVVVDNTVVLRRQRLGQMDDSCMSVTEV